MIIMPSAAKGESFCSLVYTVHIYIYRYIDIYLYIYLYIYICIKFPSHPQSPTGALPCCSPQPSEEFPTWTWEGQVQFTMHIPPQVQCPESVHQPERGWTEPGECPSHHTGWNPEHSGVHLQDGTQRQAAQGMSEATEERDRWPTRGDAVAQQSPAWDVPLTDSWAGRHREILPVTGKSRTDRQDWGTDPSSTRTGTRLQMDRSRGLPDQTGFQVQTVQRRLWNSPTHSGRMQNAGRNSKHWTAQPSGWHRVQEHLLRVWTGPSQVHVGSSEGCGEYIYIYIYIDMDISIYRSIYLYRSIYRYIYK